MDQLRPRARAMAVHGERIIALGEDTDILKTAGPHTQVIDGRGLLALPGFNDNHVHVLGMGMFLTRANLFGQNAEEIIAVLKEHHKDLKPGETVTGHAWDYAFCPHPSKEILDRAFPHNPVILRQYSGHALWVNSLALKKMLAEAERAGKSGSEILRDASGQPTGIVRGTIVHPNHRRDLLRRAFNLSFHKRLLHRALERLSAAGLTSVQDNTWQPVSAWLLRGLKRQGRLPLRISCWAFGHYPLLARAMDFSPYDRAWIRRGPVKYIADGAFSPHSARLLEAYEGEPDNFGNTVIQPEELNRIVLTHARRARRLAFHVIGDAAVRRVIDAVETAAQVYPYVRHLRYRLEHVQIIQPEDIIRMKHLGILASVQPSALALPDRDRALVGDGRFPLLYPYRSFLDAGVPLSFGSDIPGEIEYRPLIIIHRAVTRRGIDRHGPAYDLTQALTVEEAVRAYTRGSAYAEFMETQKGALIPGMLADFILLSDDIFSCDPERIPDTRVVLTAAGGRVVNGGV